MQMVGRTRGGNRMKLISPWLFSQMVFQLGQNHVIICCDNMVASR